MKARTGERDCDSILESIHESVRVWWQASSRMEIESATDGIRAALNELGRRFPDEATRSNFDGMVRGVKEEFLQGSYLNKKAVYLDFDRLMKR